MVLLMRIGVACEGNAGCDPTCMVHRLARLTDSCMSIRVVGGEGIRLFGCSPSEGQAPACIGLGFCGGVSCQWVCCGVVGMEGSACMVHVFARFPNDSCLFIRVVGSEGIRLFGCNPSKGRVFRQFGLVFGGPGVGSCRWVCGGVVGMGG